MKSEIRRNFVYYLIGIICVQSAFNVLLNLQSSINIEDGLGTTSIAISYILSVTLNLFCTPVAVRRFGAKKCIIACDFCYLIYFIANLYPEFYTLAPAGIAMGFAEATVWPCMSLVNVHFAMTYAKYAKKGNHYYISLFSGYFFTAYHLNEVLGNAISYTVLYGFDSLVTDQGNESRDGIADDFSNCGSNDCQAEGAVQSHLDQYRPTSPVTLYILIGILCILGLISILVHSLLLPDIGSYYKNRRRNTKIEENIQLNEIQNGERDEDGDEGSKGEEKRNSNDEESGIKLIKGTMKSIVKQLSLPQQLLLLLPAIYNGLAIAFAFGELTRGYTSCVLGVASVSVCMLLYGLCDIFASWAVGRFGIKVGHIKFFTLACGIELVNYFYCLYWIPSLQTSWTIYIIFGAFGITDGIMQMIINVSFVNYFPNNHEVALSIWSMIGNIGFCIQFAWSTALCIYVKVYIQIAVLICASISQVCAEYRHKKIMKQSRRESDSATVPDLPDGA